MREFLDKTDSITIDSLRNQIQRTARDTGLDVEWVKGYYDQNLNRILGIR